VISVDSTVDHCKPFLNIFEPYQDLKDKGIKLLRARPGVQRHDQCSRTIQLMGCAGAVVAWTSENTAWKIH
jgi:hypothetical protein